jgi:membrane associated rhomboid family serine protease
MTTTIIIIAVTCLVSFACFGSPRRVDALALKPYEVVEKRQWWRVVTHGFVHGDTLHLLINMIVLYSFGSAVEWRFEELSAAGTIGHPLRAYLILYFGGMVFATIRDLVKSRHNPYYASIGASGAVSAVVFTSIFFEPWAKILIFGIIPIPGILFGVLYLAYSQCGARKKRERDNINHYAHFYGALFGLFYPLLLNPALVHDFIANFRF